MLTHLKSLMSLEKEKSTVHPIDPIHPTNTKSAYDAYYCTHSSPSYRVSYRDPDAGMTYSSLTWWYHRYQPVKYGRYVVSMIWQWWLDWTFECLSDLHIGIAFVVESDIDMFLTMGSLKLPSRQPPIRDGHRLEITVWRIEAWVWGYDCRYRSDMRIVIGMQSCTALKPRWVGCKESSWGLRLNLLYLSTSSITL